MFGDLLSRSITERVVGWRSTQERKRRRRQVAIDLRKGCWLDVTSALTGWRKEKGWRHMDIKVVGWSIESFLEHAFVLRDLMEKAESRFLKFLLDFEREHEALWKTGGVETYEAFLQSHHLVNIARYRNFAAGFQKIGQQIGETAAVKADANTTAVARKLRNPTPETVTELVERSVNFHEMNGVAPSEQTAESWVSEINREEPATTRGVTELRRLRAENQQLRAENARLKKRVATLEKRLQRSQASQPNCN